MTDMTVTPANGSDYEALIAQLKAENEKLKAQAKARMQARIHCKVGEKGNLCIYGLGKFPISLYLSQYKALDAAWDDVIRPFVADHIDEFATKD